MNKIEQTITSIEVAEMVGKEHSKLLRGIRNYIEQLNQSKIGFVDFFAESTYKDSKGEIRPCYNVTKKGCEFIAHKLTGIKGTEFTAKYINRFHDMEERLTTDEQLKASLLLSIYNGGQDAVISSKQLTEIEVKEATKPLVKKIEEQKPKLEYHDAVLNKKDLLTTTMIAKDLGMTSAVKLNDILHNNKIIFKDKSGTWHPYAKYQWLIEWGYADYQSYDSEYATPSLKWTEKGRKWIIENIKEWSK